jgi:hypothetical protein
VKFSLRVSAHRRKNTPMIRRTDAALMRGSRDADFDFVLRATIQT